MLEHGLMLVGPLEATVKLHSQVNCKLLLNCQPRVAYQLSGIGCHVFFVCVKDTGSKSCSQAGPVLNG